MYRAGSVSTPRIGLQSRRHTVPSELRVNVWDWSTINTSQSTEQAPCQRPGFASELRVNVWDWSTIKTSQSIERAPCQRPGLVINQDVTMYRASSVSTSWIGHQSRRHNVPSELRVNVLDWSSIKTSQCTERAPCQRPGLVINQDVTMYRASSVSTSWIGHQSRRHNVPSELRVNVLDWSSIKTSHNLAFTEP